ncbi:MAG: DMT family protein [Candidatus Obscuribacterales bacterium]|nr:DMT family protein [Candidatus Obscuribacterales bacterium]
MNGALTIILLTISNVFMTFAWYGHLKFRSLPLWQVILFSWLIAFLEYCFQVPANRMGSFQFSAAQLKIMQEVITLVVFAIFSVLYLKQDLRWNHLLAFACIVGAVFFVFSGSNEKSTKACIEPATNELDRK